MRRRRGNFRGRESEQSMPWCFELLYAVIGKCTPEVGNYRTRNPKRKDHKIWHEYSRSNENTNKLSSLFKKRMPIKYFHSPDSVTFPSTSGGLRRISSFNAMCPSNIKEMTSSWHRTPFTLATSCRSFTSWAEVARGNSTRTCFPASRLFLIPPLNKH